MNYSTLKKTVALSFVSLVAAGAASAQMSSDTSHAATTAAKIFGGSQQYRTWTIGLNGGVTVNRVITGGVNNFNTAIPNIAGSFTIRKQLAHSFGLEADITSGWVSGSNSGAQPAAATGYAGIQSFSTHFYSGSINAVINVATVDYLARKNAINFYLQGGLGVQDYSAELFTGTVPSYGTTNAGHFFFKHPGSTTIFEAFVPVGAGVKFRLSDAWALNVGGNLYFTDGDDFDGAHTPGAFTHRDKYSFMYGGIEYTLGSKSKPNLEWVNPVAMMYDELNDPTLRQEVQALKGRVTNVEKAVDDLKKDSDGDGVADQFDKCPNTPAGTVVDGSGCPLKIPAPIDTSLFMRKGAMVQGTGTVAPTAYANIQFEFDSSGLRPTAFPILDATSADLRASKKTITVAGYASSEGTATHNLRLSKDRADAVKTYLVNSGVEAKHIKVKGYGETNPVADNSTEAGRELNRRVEFKK